jgi:hypothetical protein
MPPLQGVRALPRAHTRFYRTFGPLQHQGINDHDDITTLEMADAPTTKKYAKGERSVPHHSQKASKYYPAEDVAQPKKVRTTDRKMQKMEQSHGRGTRCVEIMEAKGSLGETVCEGSFG